jgi:replication factor C subunit 1
MVPLMVHENILTSASKKPYDLQRLHNLVQGLKGFVVGDMLDRTIRKEQEWGLMPSYGFMSCVYTTEKISENIGYPAFPSWLGKFSA